MYRIFADNPSDVLRELAALATRMADAADEAFTGMKKKLGR